MVRNAELEAAITAAPDDFTNYVVYSDWLLEQGDPRGELITLQRLQKRAEAQALLKEHAHHFYGSLADADDMVTNVDWHMGFVRSCSFATTHERYDESSEVSVNDMLTELLRHPSTAFLRDLTVGILDFEGNDYTELFGLLGEHPKPTLRTLYVGSFSSDETELNWSRIGKTEPLWKAAPNLEKLTLRSGSMDLRGIDAPNLRELVIITGGFDEISLAALSAATWPRLEALSLQLGRETEFEIADLAAIFEGAHFPVLRHLGLTNSTIEDEIAEAIVGSRIIKQLESLDLTLGTMGDEGARALANGKAALAHLKRLDVSENWISKTACHALTGICAAVFDADQRSDAGDRNNRYIAAYE